MQLDKSDHDLLVEIYVHIKDLVGNGQPGRISQIETRIDSLESSRERFRGAKWVLGIMGSVVWAVMEYLFHHKP